MCMEVPGQSIYSTGPLLSHVQEKVIGVHGWLFMLLKISGSLLATKSYTKPWHMKESKQNQAGEVGREVYFASPPWSPRTRIACTLAFMAQGDIGL